MTGGVVLGKAEFVHHSTVNFHGRSFTVCYTNAATAVDSWIARHFTPIFGPDASEIGSERLVMGLDAEWRPVFQKARLPRLALVQVATRSGDVLLYHVFHARGAFPAKLATVLGSERVLKLGVGVLEDAHKIHVLSRQIVRGCVDLASVAHAQHLALSAMDEFPGVSLKALAKHYVKCADWKTKAITVCAMRFYSRLAGCLCLQSSLRYSLADVKLGSQAVEAWANPVRRNRRVDRRADV